ncbi:MAG: hypothetical protein A3H36_00940 [Chloroflexi bacterium RIFCSPLOWO2_02_FULL_71_16]|nr:MAG: hypothetical protein A3H36_00940 [Chloroflexi bacterium RIFCSPLOWO2_02_FULL_71_16]
MVVLAAVAEEVLEQGRRDRALRVEESQLVVEAVRVRERAALVAVEHPRARLLDREPPHRDVVDPREPRAQLVLPRPVVARRGRRDLDVHVRLELVHEHSRVRLRAAGDAVAVALDHDQERRPLRGGIRHGSTSRPEETN